MDLTGGPLKGLKEYILKMQFWCETGPLLDFPAQKMELTKCQLKGLKDCILKMLFWDKSRLLVVTPGPKNGFYEVSSKKSQRVHSENVLLR